MVFIYPFRKVVDCEQEENFPVNVKINPPVDNASTQSVPGNRPRPCVVERDIAPNDSSLYIYSISGPDHVQVGICGAICASDYKRGIIKRHEGTISGKCHQSAKLETTENTYASICPVMLMYRESSELTAVVEHLTSFPPDRSTDFDGYTHCVWAVEDPHSIISIRKAFLRVDFLYIADGHHRMEAAAEAQGDGVRVMAAIFPHTHMRTHSFHRCIDGIQEVIDPEDFMHKLGEHFMISDVPADCSDPSPQDPQSMTMLYNKRWFHLRPIIREDRVVATQEDPVLALDAQIIFDLVMRPLLGIDDLHVAENVTYLSSVEVHAKDLKDMHSECSPSDRLIFCTNHVSVESIMEISAGGFVMPPKVTCFEPKVPPGIFCRLYN
mmetsp:Transcript_10078/g.15270  ORF Transcript_10078/g.15270 Transcript_10078/m.15270 type:complete len:381 (-) Transcript_10078:194-1336(-)